MYQLVRSPLHADKLFHRDDLIKRRNYAEKKNLIIRISLESHPSYGMQGADCRKGGLKPFSQPVVGEWAGSMMRLLMGGLTRYLLVRWTPLLLHSSCVSFHLSSQLSSPSSLSSPPCQSLVHRLLLFRSRHWTIARIILRTRFDLSALLLLIQRPW